MNLQTRQRRKQIAGTDRATVNGEPGDWCVSRSIRQTAKVGNSFCGILHLIPSLCLRHTVCPSDPTSWC
jgi:hypothetical protein